MNEFDLVVTGNIVPDARTVIASGFLAIRDGKVAMVGGGTPPGASERIDARGRWVIPGVIDGQVHSGSQAGFEGMGITSRAAAAGGVTVMVDMPYDSPAPVTNAALFNEKRSVAARVCHVDHALIATIAPNDAGLDEIAGLVAAGAISFKFSTYEANRTRFPRIDEDLLLAAMTKIAPSGLLCGVHNQDQELSSKNIARSIESGRVGAQDFCDAHTPLVENLASAIIYELGAESAARAHVVHCSLARGFEICNMYRRAGHRASIETCVQYLMLDADEHVARFGNRTKHYPPMRPKAETERLWRHVAAGDCDFVSSDHVAWGLERKSDPDVFKCSAGGPGIEVLLPAMWTGCEEHRLPPTLAVDLLCAGPARAFGLDDRKGSLAPGKDADFVILETGEFAYDPATSLSGATWSSFEGRRLTVRVESTFVRGRQAFDGKRVVNSAGDGRFLAPTRR
ncbi:MAG: amidohydrolase family protein [Burkholderiaceae bacterium]|nr:amidohydrolase family protein [Burkholderiaceae bacterium]